MSCSNVAVPKLQMFCVLVQQRTIALLGLSEIIHVGCMHFVWLKPLHRASLIIMLKLDVFFFRDSKEVCRCYAYLPLK